MSRPRLPTKVLELRGSFKHDPQRRRAREGEPEPTGVLGAPPDHLGESERARWNEVRKWCPWLTVADRYVVERVARLMTLDRANQATSAQAKQLDLLLGRLGMTPSDRSKVKVPGERPGKKKPNAFKALA